jgi:uncharacterized protein (TIGR00255 family)
VVVEPPVEAQRGQGRPEQLVAGQNHPVGDRVRAGEQPSAVVVQRPREGDLPVSEEIARLRSHLEQFDRLCDSRQHAGRKLDFVSQEMLREANTIGSKSNDAMIARHIVEIKALIDRLKEQVQNVE